MAFVAAVGVVNYRFHFGKANSEPGWATILGVYEFAI